MTGSPLHFVSLAISAFLIIALVWADRRWHWRRRIGWAAFGLWCAMTVAWLWPGMFEVNKSLPLHVCDIAALVGAGALIRDWRWARGVLFFWGFGLTTQGFVTPVVEAKPGELAFWLFWVNHFVVLAMATVDFVVGGYRPRPRDTAGVIVASALYVGAMFALNAATGWNYGYVGPDQVDSPATALDWFGPWPMRVGVMVCLVTAWFVFLGRISRHIKVK